MASSCLAEVRVITELGQFIVECGNRGFFLLQDVGDEGLLTVLDRLFIREQFFYIVGAWVVWHRGLIPLARPSLKSERLVQ